MHLNLIQLSYYRLINMKCNSDTTDVFSSRLDHIIPSTRVHKIIIIIIRNHKNSFIYAFI